MLFKFINNYYTINGFMDIYEQYISKYYKISVEFLEQKI